MQDITAMLTYIAQLERLAAHRKISLAAAMRKAQVSDSQLYRWRQGKGSPRLDTARRIEKAIFDMGARDAAAVQGNVPKRRVARVHAQPAGTTKRAWAPA